MALWVHENKNPMGLMDLPAQMALSVQYKVNLKRKAAKSASRK